MGNAKLWEKQKSTGTIIYLFANVDLVLDIIISVSDMRSLVIMRETNCPVVFDATHSDYSFQDRIEIVRVVKSVYCSIIKGSNFVGISGIFMRHT